MAQKNGSNEPNLTPLLCLVGGGLLGAAWQRNQTEEAKKSRAEREYPDRVQEVRDEIEHALDSWEPDEASSTEDDFVGDLAEHVHAETGYMVELNPSTREWRPDILVEGVLALEIKVNPSKSERDRCIGQCAGYSRLWATWIVLIDASLSAEEDLYKLLVDKGLEHIDLTNISAD